MLHLKRPKKTFNRRKTKNKRYNDQTSNCDANPPPAGQSIPIYRLRI